MIILCVYLLVNAKFGSCSCLVVFDVIIDKSTLAKVSTEVNVVGISLIQVNLLVGVQRTSKVLENGRH